MKNNNHAYHCDWCKKEIEKEPIIGGQFKEKKFCSYSCHNNDHDYWNDNCHIDADLGL